MNKSANIRIETIGLFGRRGDVEVAKVIRGLCEFLHARQLDILLDEATANLVAHPLVPSRPLDSIGAEIDLAIVIGGDGSLLHVARSIAKWRVPLVGVNVGRLGFLADISTDNMLEMLGDILAGDFQTEERFLLHADIVRGGKIIHSFNPLNDVVLNKGDLARLIEFETYIDGNFVSSTRADGIIVATPTGSTAYALSAGGPILHPTLPAIILVPICPHTLSYRPIAINSDSKIEIVLTDKQPAHVTFDGQATLTVQPHDRVRVRRGDTPVTLIHPTNRNHYVVLRKKLMWGTKL